MVQVSFHRRLSVLGAHVVDPRVRHAGPVEEDLAPVVDGPETKRRSPVQVAVGLERSEISGVPA